jgi:hypothetical protein
VLVCRLHVIFNERAICRLHVITATQFWTLYSMAPAADSTLAGGQGGGKGRAAPSPKGASEEALGQEPLGTQGEGGSGQGGGGVDGVDGGEGREGKVEILAWRGTDVRRLQVLQKILNPKPKRSLSTELCAPPERAQCNIYCL